MKLLRKLYSISSPSGKEREMVNYVEKVLIGYGAVTRRDKLNNLYATKGHSSTYPCVVAHTDEVHHTRDPFFRVETVGDVMFGFGHAGNNFEGIGADDKNGIWVALKAFKKFDIIKAAFFVSEEIGCVGSASADMDFFTDCRFVLQADRMGSSDLITVAAGVELCSTDFISKLPLIRYGYKEVRGSITDVMQLKENGLNVCALNISCGYYNPHCDNEYTDLIELRNCRDFMFDIIRNMEDVYPHEPVPYFYGKRKSSNWQGSYYNNYYDDWGVDMDNSSYVDGQFIDYDSLLVDVESIILAQPNLDDIDDAVVYNKIISLYPEVLYDDIASAFYESMGRNLFESSEA